MLRDMSRQYMRIEKHLCTRHTVMGRVRNIWCTFTRLTLNANTSMNQNRMWNVFILKSRLHQVVDVTFCKLAEKSTYAKYFRQRTPVKERDRK